MSEVLAKLEKKGGEDKLSEVVGIFAHDAYSTAPSFTAEVGKYYFVSGGGANATITELLASATGADIIEQSYIESRSGYAYVRQYASLIKATATTVSLTSRNNANYYVFKLS